MKKPVQKKQTRRQFVKGTLAAGAAVAAGPYLSLGAAAVERPVTRVLGRTGVEVTTFGLGGQASLQWTPEDVKPAEIIVKAYNLGLTYFDTSNVYDGSQTNYGEAFRALGLVPGRPNYDEAKRRGIFVASKTMIRLVRGTMRGTISFTNGPQGSTVVDDLERSLTLVFGDGKGGYPGDAYFDLFQVHNLTRPQDVEAAYAGLDDPGPGAENVGVLATLLDYRDGTNRTGLNPKEEKRIRHIGISGHYSSPLLMDCIQRDTEGIIDTLLTVANANDLQYLNHQHNVIPVAAAKGIGIIGMKVFSDGTMYTKPGHWTQGPHEVVRTVGTPDLPSEPLIQYSLSVPGVVTNIIGIGHIEDDPKRCQLEQNLAASQMEGVLDETQRKEVEALAAQAKEGQTNYFQMPTQPLGAPRDAAASQEMRGDTRVAKIAWQTAFAAQAPIARYEIQRDGKTVAGVDHLPQTSKAPFTYEEELTDRRAHRYRVVTTDAAGRTAESDELVLESTG